MENRTPFVALLLAGMYVSGFQQSVTAPDASAGAALGTLVGVSIVALAVFRLAYGRSPLPGLLSSPFWFGKPLAHKLAITVAVAMVLQLILPLGYLAPVDIWVTPILAGIVFAVGLAAWRVGQLGRSRLAPPSAGVD